MLARTQYMRHFCIVLTFLSVLLPNPSDTIPVDNGVEGEPEIECGPRSITVNFNTRNPFQGHVFVKGLFDQPGCRVDEHGRQVAGIELAFDSCNVARTRSLNPKGIYVTTTVVISFHPQFITKVDRAYHVQCFYMEADKTVSSQADVSDLTTTFQTQLVPMPICKYEILEGGPNSPPVHYATIGQHVYHKWTCDSETVDTFCALVHSCTVDDGNGDTVKILDENGCALDKFLLNNLEYPGDLMAGQEAHVYKYADRSQLFYQCQITITIKEPNGDCPRPKCPEPSGFNAVKLGPAGNSSSPGARGGQAAGIPPLLGITDSPPLAPTDNASVTAASPAIPYATRIPPSISSANPPLLRRQAASRQATTTTTFPTRVQDNILNRLLKKRETEAGFDNIMDVRAELNTLDIVIDEIQLFSSQLLRPHSRKSGSNKEIGRASFYSLSLLVAMSGATVAVVTIFYICFVRPLGNITTRKCQFHY